MTHKKLFIPGPVEVDAEVLGKMATARASLYIYNDQADVDILCDSLIEMRRFFGL